MARRKQKPKPKKPRKLLKVTVTHIAPMSDAEIAAWAKQFVRLVRELLGRKESG